MIDPKDLSRGRGMRSGTVCCLTRSMSSTMVVAEGVGSTKELISSLVTRWKSSDQSSFVPESWEKSRLLLLNIVRLRESTVLGDDFQVKLRSEPRRL